MRQDQIGAWLEQETCEEEEEAYGVEIGGYHIFWNTSEAGESGSGREHLFGGVAIVLSPEYYEAWKFAGSRPPITSDKWGEHTRRCISMKVKFK